MAYENIRFTYPNMSIYDGQFYMIDTSSNCLIKKTADGLHIATYPIDTPFISSVLSLCSHRDYFYTLQSGTTSSGLIVKKFKITNDSYLKLLNTFTYYNSSDITFDSKSLALETYITTLEDTVSGTTQLYLNDYYDNENVLYPGTYLYIGDPNYEEVLVTDITNGYITIASGVTCSYEAGTKVTWCNNFFITNNYYKSTTSDKGMLLRFTTSSGHYASSEIASDYKTIIASSFYRFQNVFLDSPDSHALVFIKNDTSATVCDPSNMLNLINAATVSDSFIGDTDSDPNTSLWDLLSC